MIIAAEAEQIIPCAHYDAQTTTCTYHHFRVRGPVTCDICSKYTPYELHQKKSLNQHEPDPVKHDGPAMWDLVIADMQERDTQGAKKYGTRLQANNGRDPLVDAYQEALDLVVYLRQAIYERSLHETRVDQQDGRGVSE